MICEIKKGTAMATKDEWKPRKEYAAERQRREVAARKVAQEQTHDPVVEACVIAYFGHRTEGGQMMWADFRRQWYADRSIQMDQQDS